MISSKLFTTLLRYNIDNTDYDSACESLLEKVKEPFESNLFTDMFKVITADYIYKHEKQDDSKIDIVIMIYATVDTDSVSDKVFKKLFTEFIDLNCSEFDDIDVHLVSREVTV